MFICFRELQEHLQWFQGATYARRDRDEIKQEHYNNNFFSQLIMGGKPKETSKNILTTTKFHEKL